MEKKWFWGNRCLFIDFNFNADFNTLSLQWVNMQNSNNLYTDSYQSHSPQGRVINAAFTQES